MRKKVRKKYDEKADKERNSLLHLSSQILVELKCGKASAQNQNDNVIPLLTINFPLSPTGLKIYCTCTLSYIFNKTHFRGLRMKFPSSN
jgi:hypothetical protein